MWKTIVITFICITLCLGCSNSGNVKTIIDKDASSDMQNYIDFIHDDHDEQVTFTAKEDIDLDGYDEIVVAFGSSNKDPELGYV